MSVLPSKLPRKEEKIWEVEIVETIFDRVNSLLEAEVATAAGLELALDRKSYVCPKCGRGSKRDRPDGIKQKLRKGRLNWWCPHCGDNMSNVDVCAVAHVIDPTDTAATARLLEELFPHLKSDKNFSPSRESARLEPKRNTCSETEQLPPECKDYSRMYYICRRALPNFLATVGGKWRGLSRETLGEAGAGYNVNYKGKKVIVLPYDNYTFFWREIDGKGRGVNKGGKRRLYETLPLKVGDGTINFLTEGEIDALSIKQVFSSFKEQIGVAATGSASFINMTIKELNNRYETCADLGTAIGRKPRFIFVADNDKAGVEGAEKFVKALNSAGYPAVAIFFAEDSEAKVDANDYLCKHGDAGLNSFLVDAVDDTTEELDKKMAEIKQSAKEKREAEALEHGIKLSSLTDYLEDEFDAELDRMKNYSGRATGFENLDVKQYFLPGVYILGGKPGAGKTTFAWQLLNQLAEGNELEERPSEYCVYCSYEMSRLELASKSIAREMRRKKLANNGVGLCLSSADIRRGNGRDTDNFKAARKKIKATAQNLIVAELSNTTLPELMVQLKDAALEASAKNLLLTVAVDYLQLIPVKDPKATAKERVDEIMLALKTFQRENNATLIILSSCNRESNKQGGDTMFSFKESGAIEYSADVTWVLECEKKELEKTPRYVILKCAKNRNGAPYDAYFNYYADSDYFCGTDRRKESDTDTTAKSGMRR